MSFKKQPGAESPSVPKLQPANGSAAEPLGGSTAQLSGQSAAQQLEQISQGSIPTHVACVMDGNGRWASKRGWVRTRGHNAGEAAMFDTIEGALEAGISWFTVYAFSTENWRRPQEEVSYLLGFSRKLLRQRLNELHERNVRIRFLGRREQPVNHSLIAEMMEAEELTRNNTQMTLSVAFNYGGRAEIVDALRSLLVELRASQQPNGSQPAGQQFAGQPPDSVCQITEADVSRHLYAPDMPDPDLVIRTSGESRISNFLLWQIAYSELVFFDVLWPDFRREHLFEAILEYQRRERRYGGC